MYKLSENNNQLLHVTVTFF